MARPCDWRRILRLLAAGTVAIGAGPGSGALASAKPPPAVGAYTTRGAWSFASAPNLHPPKLLTHGRTVTDRLAPGYFLLTNFPAVNRPGPMIGQGGPLIVDNRLRPVWFQSVGTGVVSADLQQETYQGEPVLVWWQGVLTRMGGTRSGAVVVVDRHYRRLATLRAPRPWVISLHDAVISGPDIWVTVYRYVQNQNLVAYGGSRKGTVYDVGIQEYDLASGRLLYTWDALNPGRAPNVPLSDSEQPARAAPGGVWDAYHLNAVQVLSGNRILISIRNTWAAYLIDTTTNRIEWTLGGKRSSFKLAPAAGFAWQHDVKLVANNEVTLFNDNCCKLQPNGKFASPNGPSEGMVLRLDPIRLTASLVAAYPHTPTLDSAFLGNMQLLGGGNALVGWGSLPYFTEYTRTGRQVLDVVFPGKDQSYRALFSSNWVGTPYFPPAAAVRNARRRTTVYASWNGATTVAAWQVLGGSSARRLRLLATARRRNGFETAIGLGKTSYKVFEVRALDWERQVIGTSRPVRR